MTTDEWAGLAEQAWRYLEPYHAVAYFAPEHRAACDAAGLKGGWMAYFATRSAPLGAVGPEVVTALFHGFHPAMVGRAIPDAWHYSSPERVLQARLAGVDAALQRILGDDLANPEITTAASLLTAAVQAADPAGRALFASHAALPLPDEPHLRLFWATTALREHRGDGHVATLVAEGIGGCEAHVLQVAAGRVRREGIQPFRGWSDDEWQTATERLSARGWLDHDGAITASGRTARTAIEDRTNVLAAAPFQALGPDRAAELMAALRPVAARIGASGAMPYPNPIGVPAPEDTDLAGQV